MLQFTQGTTTVIVLGDNVIQTTRFIHNRLCMLLTKCDGTIGDFAKKVNKVSELNDEMFEDFDRIRRESNDVD